MKFGTIHTAIWDLGTHQPDVLRETVDRMIFSERCGFYSAWTTEHHFANDPAYLPFDWKDGGFGAYDLVPDPITFLAYVAARTTRIRLGTGILCLPYHNPIAVAERIAMLDALSGGRAEIGVGRGGGDTEHREHMVFNAPIDPVEEMDRFYESLDVVLASWTGQRFSHKGKYFEVPELAIVPSPIQRPHPPVYLASLNERSLRYAAERGLSYTAVTGTWGLSAVPYHNKNHRFFEETCQAMGKDISDTLYPNTQFLYCAESDQEAHEVAEESLLRYVAQAEAHYERQRYGRPAMPALSTLAGGPGADATLQDVRALIKGLMPTNLIGSPNTICEKFTALREQVPSLNYALCVTDGGSPSSEFVRKSMQLFATKAMPRLAQSRPVRAIA